MKKVLVTGASGTLGILVIKYLLAEGKYNITAVDLQNSGSTKKLNKYRKRVNVIYGDVLDRYLMESLIKEQDYVIHLASILPPLSEYKRELVNIIEKDATENIVRAINFYNPDCKLIYASSTSIYQNQKANIKSKIEVIDENCFNNAKINAEKFIIKKCPNYIILRVPLILSDLCYDNFIYNIKLDSVVECLSKEDAAYAFVKCLDTKLNNDILNIGGGKTCQTSYRELLIRIMKYHGLTFKSLLSLLFVKKNYCSPVLEDSDNSNKKLEYRNDSLDSYFMRQKRRSRKKALSKFFGKIAILFLKWGK